MVWSRRSENHFRARLGRGSSGRALWLRTPKGCGPAPSQDRRRGLGPLGGDFRCLGRCPFPHTPGAGPSRLRSALPRRPRAPGVQSGQGRSCRPESSSRLYHRNPFPADAPRSDRRPRAAGDCPLRPWRFRYWTERAGLRCRPCLRLPLSPFPPTGSNGTVFAPQGFASMRA